MPASRPAMSEGAPVPPSTGLFICRNKHWRHISAYHGPWLQLPIEILETLAHQNWTMPSPRLIDPAVFFDIVKIRRHVDEAAHESVRASTGISNIPTTGRMDYFGAGGGPSSQLSKERIFRIRHKAVDLLAKAYALDEIAASVAVMQATSSVEDVASHVLKRESTSPHANYVHFFHERVPSRAMEQHTTAATLSAVIERLPWEERIAPLRTRAYVHHFRHQNDAAIADITLALQMFEDSNLAHRADFQELDLASRMRAQPEEWQRGSKDWRSIPRLKEEEQPTSLGRQLLFNRASVFLFLAHSHVAPSLAGLKEYLAAEAAGDKPSSEQVKAHNARLDARKRVKGNAKRALKDLMSFLAHFEYTPGLPYDFTNEIMQQMHELTNGGSRKTIPVKDTGCPTTTNGTALVKTAPSNGTQKQWPAELPLPRIYTADQLFLERPVQDLPPLFNGAQAQSNASFIHEALGSKEVVTYHPLLTEALHALLLCHTLLQTSPTELHRHAINVARLVRVTDGYPIFQSARSKSKVDWADIIADNKDWLKLPGSWYHLTKPGPLSEAAAGIAKDGDAVSKSSVRGQQQQQQQQRGDSRALSEATSGRLKEESILDALSDDRVVDEETFRHSVRAHLQKAAADSNGAQGTLTGPTSDGDAEACANRLIEISDRTPESEAMTADRVANEDNYSSSKIRSKRAECLNRWIREAPLSLGIKKKRPVKKRKPATAAAIEPGDTAASSSLAESVSTLSVADDEEVD